uniref:Probable oligoribonuclease n=1 Tax=Glossina pallidipes TaxID=7398 RepID=A0A1A9Z749_GLOPL
MFKKLRTLFNTRHLLEKVFETPLSVRNFSVTSSLSNKMAKTKGKASFSDAWIVWMDLEMTGLEVEKDQILEVSCLISDEDLVVKAEGPHIVINYPPDVFENMNDWCKKHHFESGLVDKCLKSQITLNQAEQQILEFLKQHIPKRECPLAGNSIYMDRLFLKKYMPIVDDYLNYRIIDVSSIKELAKRWNTRVYNAAPKKKLVHRASDDVKESLEELQYYKNNLFKLN